MPCSTCTDEARCDRAGLCQDFRRDVPPAAFRPVHGGYPEGVRPVAELDDCPKCDKCGAPITTGSMAVFCPFARECAFVEDDGQWESVEDFRKCFGIEREPLRAVVNVSAKGGE